MLCLGTYPAASAGGEILTVGRVQIVEGHTIHRPPLMLMYGICELVFGGRRGLHQTPLRPCQAV